MPVLPLEPFVLPEDLLQDPSGSPADPARWWALHTRPRAEKSLARRLLKREVGFFLPLHSKQWRHKGSLLTSHNPLFPGYLFLHGDDDARCKALETNLVARTLPVEDQRQLHADLARVYRLMTTDQPLTPEERLEPGTVVEILHGPLTGLQGKVVRRGKQLRLVVEVQFLQRGVSAEIETWMVRLP